MIIECVIRILKIQASLFSTYFTWVGLIYLCGVYKNTRLGNFIWKFDNEWALNLKDIIAGKPSADFQSQIFLLICLLYITTSVLKYLKAASLWHSRHSNIKLLHNSRYYLSCSVAASMIIMAFIYFAHNKISIDMMIWVIFIAFIGNAFNVCFGINEEMVISQKESD